MAKYKIVKVSNPEDYPHQDFGGFIDDLVDTVSFSILEEHNIRFNIELSSDDPQYMFSIHDINDRMHVTLNATYDSMKPSGNPRPKISDKTELRDKILDLLARPPHTDDAEIVARRASNLADAVNTLQSKGYRFFPAVDPSIDHIENGLRNGYATVIDLLSDSMARNAMMRKAVDDILPVKNLIEVPYVQDSDNPYADFKNYIEKRVDPTELRVVDEHLMKFAVGFGRDEPRYIFQINLSENVMDVRLRIHYNREKSPSNIDYDPNRPNTDHLEIIARRADALSKAVHHIESRGHNGSFMRPYNVDHIENGLNLAYSFRIEPSDDPTMRNAQMRSIAMDVIPEKYHKNSQLKH